MSDYALLGRYLPDFSLNSRRQATPPPSMRQATRRRKAGWGWHGIFTARTWAPEIAEDAWREYRIMQVGGKTARLALPDRYARDGQPIYLLTDAERRASVRLRNRFCLDRVAEHNIACNAGRTTVLNYLANTGGLTGVQYIAIGTGTLGSGEPAAGDMQLANEIFRNTWTTATVSGNLVDISLAVQAAQANATWTECGVFGDGATSSANSGQLYAHASLNYIKTNTVVVTLDYDLTLS